MCSISFEVVLLAKFRLSLCEDRHLLLDYYVFFAFSSRAYIGKLTVSKDMLEFVKITELQILNVSHA